MIVTRPTCADMIRCQRPVMAFRTRIIAQRICGNRRAMIIAGEIQHQIVRALPQTHRTPQCAAAAVTIDAGGLLLRVICRECRRVGLGRLPIVFRFRFGVARRAKRVLILQPKRNTDPADCQDCRADNHDDYRNSQFSHRLNVSADFGFMAYSYLKASIGCKDAARFAG